MAPIGRIPSGWMSPNMLVPSHSLVFSREIWDGIAKSRGYHGKDRVPHNHWEHFGHA